MATGTSISRRLGAAVRELGSKKSSSAGGGWYTPLMAAASRAIRDRVPLVDLVLDVRDARIPLTSSFWPPRQEPSSQKHIIVMNKIDLADRSATEKWMKHFGEQNYICYGVNSHNKDSIKGLLNLVRARIKELKVGEADYTATVLLTGIPNVGKSALANSMHQIGRISAAEKGKLKHAVVSSQPGETKDISSFKIASHPNIYILDSPGVLSPEVTDDECGSKLALTGAIRDSLLGERELAYYLMTVLNSAEEYKCWEKMIDAVADISSDDRKNNSMSSDYVQRKRQYSSDHTQDFIVRDVRRTLFKTISSCKGNLEKEIDMVGLIDSQFSALHEAFRVALSEFGQAKNPVITGSWKLPPLAPFEVKGKCQVLTVGEEVTGPVTVSNISNVAPLLTWSCSAGGTYGPSYLGAWITS
ncbi:putative DAR GTPase 2, mitochondrial [Iris pallida]|uniref:DAR GTPase 2, mitochondrial n=1 Tax=Iris pallida TaxID=29817 RepID=A0AAX6EKL8_IRIPA|nr:putative DAR GTPase 2, mitochondrial [Iris pallida]